MDQMLKQSKIKKDVLKSVIAAALNNIENRKQTDRVEDDDFLPPDMIQDDHQNLKLLDFGNLIKPSSFHKYSPQSSNSFSESEDSKESEDCSIYGYLAVPNRNLLSVQPSTCPSDDKVPEINSHSDTIRGILKKEKYRRYGKDI
jgi:hypothetical protein